MGYQPPATPAGKVNVTDPDSRNVKTSRGWVQGYNAQAAVTAEQIVIAAEVTVDSPDFGHLEPMVNAAQRELTAIGIDTLPEVVAPTRRPHGTGTPQMESIVNRGHRQMGELVNRGMRQVLIPPDAGKRKGEPGWNGGLYAFMRRVLDTEHGGKRKGERRADGGLYAMRRGSTRGWRALRQAPRHDRARVRRHEHQQTMRPRYERRSRRPIGMAAKKITATHNLLKLWRHTADPMPA